MTRGGDFYLVYSSLVQDSYAFAYIAFVQIFIYKSHACSIFLNGSPGFISQGKDLDGGKDELDKYFPQKGMFGAISIKQCKLINQYKEGRSSVVSCNLPLSWQCLKTVCQSSRVTLVVV